MCSTKRLPRRCALCGHLFLLDAVRVGLFFGSFNPIHVGHLLVAQYMRVCAGFDEVWLVVSPHNPLKDPHVLVPAEHRLAMVS